MAEIHIKNEEVGSSIAKVARYIVNLEREFGDCRNELCLRCGQYKQRHLGACDGCRWRDNG